MNKRVIDHYGLEEQLIKTTEEAAELIKAVNKYRTVIFKKGYIPSNKYTPKVVLDNLKEELAHVTNCIRSLEYLIDIDPNEIDSIISESDKTSVMRLELSEEDEEETPEDSNEADSTSDDYDDENADWVDVLLARVYLRKIIPILKEEDAHPALIIALADTIRDYMNHRKDS